MKAFFRGWQIDSSETSVPVIDKPLSKHYGTSDWCQYAWGCLWKRNDVIFVNLYILPEYWLRQFCRLQITQPVWISFLWWKLWICFFAALASLCSSESYWHLLLHDKPTSYFKLYFLSPLWRILPLATDVLYLLCSLKGGKQTLRWAFGNFSVSLNEVSGKLSCVFHTMIEKHHTC